LVKSIVLVPVTEKEEDFNVVVPVDLREYQKLIDTTSEETGVVVSRKLSMKADVWTSFETEVGLVNETFSQTVSATLTGPKLEWSKELTQTSSGSRSKRVVTEHPEIEDRRLYSTIAAGVFMLAFLYLLGNYAILILSRILTSRASPEHRNLQIEKKRKDLIVNIAGLPPLNEGDTIIEVSSLDDLVRVSDSFIKPVLRKPPTNAKDPFVYYVIDGSTRYEYLFKQELPSDISQESHSTSNEETPDT
jgi:hypothetical protein